MKRLSTLFTIIVATSLSAGTLDLPRNDGKHYDESENDVKQKTIRIAPERFSQMSEESDESRKNDSGEKDPEDQTVYKQSFDVKEGSTLESLFDKAGLSKRQMYEVINGQGKSNRIQNLYPGEEIRFSFRESDDQLSTIELERTPLKSIVVKKTSDGYVGEVVEKEPEIKLKASSGEIKSSFYIAAGNAGLSPKIAMSVIDIFSWDLDFVYDIRGGEKFSVVYEELFVDGHRVGTGKVLAAEITANNEKHQALYFPEDEDKYFTPEGRSLRKAFLRTPINARVSSPFNLQRRHPVLDVVRPHEGIDYAAPVGTPIKASGQGKIVHAGWKGGYGRTVVIRHGNGITTLYAHMNRLKSGIREGDEVTQGEILGYLGSSGMVTGPHLHYEFRVQGEPKDPSKVDLPDAEPIADQQMADFRRKTNVWRVLLENNGLAEEAPLMISRKAQ